MQPGPALAKVRAFVSHGVQDQKLGVHFARNAKEVLDGFVIPLQYHEYEAGHELNKAMAGDFNYWLDAQLDQSDDPHI